MTYRERLCKDQAVYRELSQSEKRAFLWDYYKIPILAVICAVVLGGIALAQGLSSRSVGVYAVLVNADTDSAEAENVLEQILREANVDLAGKRIDTNAALSLGQGNRESEDVQTVQVLSALFGVSGLDFFAADPDTFLRYAVQNAFADLRKLIEPQMLSQFEKDLVYCTTEENGMILCGIRLHSGSALHRSGVYSGDAVIGIAAAGENMDTALKLLLAILEQS